MSYALITTRNDDNAYYSPFVVALKDSKEEIVGYTDCLLRNLGLGELMSELSNMQAASMSPVDGTLPTVFNNKFTIPDYFINLVLSKYYLRIVNND